MFSQEPTQEFIDELKKTPLNDALVELGVVVDDIFYENDAAQQVGFEYVRVFVGAGPKHVPPYESVFTDSRKIGDKEVQRLMLGPSAVAVAKIYQESGYKPNPKFKDMPDHLAVELGYMEELCREEMQALKSNDQSKADSLRDKQKQFLTEHLLRWVDDFAKDIEDFAHLKFYSSCARVLAQFLKSEARMPD